MPRKLLTLKEINAFRLGISTKTRNVWEQRDLFLEEIFLLRGRITELKSNIIMKNRKFKEKSRRIK